MSGYRRRTLQRVDSTQAALVKEAEAYGCEYVHLGVVIDGLLFHKATQRLWVVDWKRPKGKLTEAQAKLVDRGIPIFFIENSQQLRDLIFGKAA